MLRPELKQQQALIEGAEVDSNGVRFGPLVPSVGASVFAGGLGGGRNSDWGHFGEQQDYSIGLGWRVGPGGLFDLSRQWATKARLTTTRTGAAKFRDEVVRQVAEAFTRLQSQSDQIQMARSGLEAAEEGFRLARQRQEFGVGVILENVLAEQDLTGARDDYLKAVAELTRLNTSFPELSGCRRRCFDTCVRCASKRAACEFALRFNSANWV